jgi:hypothetical protein
MNPTVILALINAGLTLAEHLPDLLAALKRTGELTPEQEAALDARIAALPSLAHWLVEPDPE